MKKAVNDWLSAAKDDLKVVSKILEDPTITNMAAFHCQQATEKTLKSILEQYESKVPRFHNIITLKAMTEAYVPIEIDEELLTLINDVYIDSRYPSSIGLLPNGKPCLKTAQRFFSLLTKFLIKQKPTFRNR